MLTRRILVTGANGMLGRALIKRLVEEELEIVACIRQGNLKLFSGIDSAFLRTYESDITRGDWSSILSGVTDVIHLAAKVHVHKMKDQSWDDFYQTNVAATRELCDAVVENGVSKFIFLSTVGVYGDYPRLDSEGELVIGPNNYYSKSKLLAESIVRDTLKNRVPYVILRPVMIFGPGDRGNMRRMINAVKKGLFLSPGGGNNRKSAMYVEDVVEIIYRILLRQDVLNETFIVSNKNVLSLKEIYRTISLKTSSNGHILSVPTFIMKILAVIGDLVPVIPFNSSVLKKLTIDSDYSQYSVIQDILGIKHETPFGDALSYTEMYHYEGSVKG